MRVDLVQGDSEPQIELPFADVGLTPAPTVASFPDGSTVAFKMDQVNGSGSVAGAGALAAQAFAYRLRADGSDTATPGVYRARFTVSYPDAGTESFPVDEPFYVVIHPSV